MLVSSQTAFRQPTLIKNCNWTDKISPVGKKMQTGLTEKQLKLRKPAQAFLATLFLMTNRVPIIIAIAIGRTISQFGMIPAMI